MRALLITLIVSALAACDTASPEAGAAGDYRAERFLVTEGGSPVDVLAGGGRLDVSLDASGQFEAFLGVPGALTEDGEPVEARFDGTYSVSGTRVRFYHGEDYFLRDLTWTLEGGALVADESLPQGARLDLVLGRR